MIRLYGIGGVFGILSRIVTGSAKGWFASISILAMAAGLVVFLVGTVDARRALEAKRKAGLI